MGFTIEKRGYSRKPWRIISPDGLELSRSKVMTTHCDFRGEVTNVIEVSGFDTKAEALAYLGEYAWKVHSAAVDKANGRA